MTRSLSPLARCALVAAAAVIVLALADAALAQPFGMPRGVAAPQPVGGLTGYILAKQAEFYRLLSGTIRAAKADGSAGWTLLGISFLYGIFHAAGPGHGKAVISSYLVANGETAKRGIALSFASALLQALVAVLIVGIAAWALNATARTMCNAEKMIEIASYALIAALGLRLVWVKGGAFIGALQAAGPVPAMAGVPHDTGHDHHHDYRHGHGHHQAHDHVHDAHCGHSHGPAPSDLAGPGGWRRGLAAVLTVGIRPCSGAILVLVFALAQGLFWAGIAATLLMGLGTAITVAAIAVIAVSAEDIARRLSAGRRGGALVMRAIELGAAGLVLLFGVGLLFGYLAAERTTCF